MNRVGIFDHLKKMRWGKMQLVMCWGKMRWGQSSTTSRRGLNATKRSMVAPTDNPRKLRRKKSGDTLVAAIGQKGRKLSTEDVVDHFETMLKAPCPNHTATPSVMPTRIVDC